MRADTDQVTEALRFVRESGAPNMLARWRAVDKAGSGRVGTGGMPPWLADDRVFALLHLVTNAGQPQTVDAIASLITSGLSRESLQLLDLDVGRATFQQVRGRVDRSLHRTLDVLDPHPGPKQLKRTFAEMRAYEADLDPALVGQRKRRLLELSNAFLAETFRVIPEPYRRRWQGNCAVDATFVQAFTSKGTSYTKTENDDLVASEPFGGYYIRRGGHGISGEEIKALPRSERVKLGKVSWGWEATLVTMGANYPDEIATFPLLVVGMNFHPPGIAPGPHAVDALQLMHEAGMPANYLAADRNYGPKPRSKDFTSPLRALGYKLIWDLTEKEIGRVRRIQGAALLEGNLYCPAVLSKEPLVFATKDRYPAQPSVQAISDDEYDKRIKQRGRYLLKAHGTIQPNGSARFMCPAAGNAPTLTCPLRWRDDPKVEGLWPVKPGDLPPPEDRGPICSADTVTFKPSERFPRFFQEKQYGSPEWLDWYKTLRQSIESYNAYLKLGTATAIHVADRRRVRGFAAANLFVAMAVVTVNLRKIERWMQEPVPVDSRGRGPAKPRKTRRREKLGYGPRTPRSRGQEGRDDPTSQIEDPGPASPVRPCS